MRSIYLQNIIFEKIILAMAKEKSKTKKRVIPEGSKQVNFNLPETQLDKVKYIVSKDGGNNSDVYNVAISQYVNRWEKKNGEIKMKK